MHSNQGMSCCLIHSTKLKNYLSQQQFCPWNEPLPIAPLFLCHPEALMILPLMLEVGDTQMDVNFQPEIKFSLTSHHCVVVGSPILNSDELNSKALVQITYQLSFLLSSLCIFLGWWCCSKEIKALQTNSRFNYFFALFQSSGGVG